MWCIYMGKLSLDLVNEIEAICSKINSETTSPAEKEILYERLEAIYAEYFIHLKTAAANSKGS